jgi:hypothetical protein
MWSYFLNHLKAIKPHLRSVVLTAAVPAGGLIVSNPEYCANLLFHDREYYRKWYVRKLMGSKIIAYDLGDNPLVDNTNAMDIFRDAFNRKGEVKVDVFKNLRQ